MSSSDRLFFAVFPDAATGSRIFCLGHALRCQHCLQGTALAFERLHVSLHQVGDYDHPPDERIVAAARDRASDDVRYTTCCTSR